MEATNIDDKFEFRMHMNLRIRSIVYEKETLPVFKPQDVLEYSYEKNNSYKVYFKKTVYVETTWPFNRTCADDFQTFTGWQNLYEHYHYLQSSYNFSLKGCLDRCVYNLTETYCKCIIPYSMTQHNVNRTPICSRICNKIPQKDFDSLCNCTTPCRYLEVKHIKMETEKYDDKQLSAYISKAFENKYNHSYQLQIHNHTKDRPKSELLNFLISKSVLAKVEYKHPLLRFDDLLSCIGGVWGLWIGLSCSILFSIGIKALSETFPTTYKTSYKQLFPISYHAIQYLGMLIIGSACVWQLYITIDEYLKYNVITTETIEDQDSFPTIYVCPKPAMYLDGLDDLALAENADLAEKAKNLKDMMFFQNDDEEYDFKNDLWSDFSQEECYLLAPKISEMILECGFRTENGLHVPCKYDILEAVDTEFSFPIICAVINPQTLNYSIGLKVTNLNMRVAPLKDVHTKSSSVEIKVGLSPFILFYDNEMIPEVRKKVVMVEPGDAVDVTFTLTETRRLPAPYSSKCVSEHAKYSNFPFNINDHINFNYSYTFEECLYYCLSDGVYYESYSEENINFCDCHSPCKQKDFEVKSKIKKFVYKNKITPNVLIDGDHLLDYLWNGSAVVRISREVNTKKMIREKPAMELINLVGVFGGIFGLWIGKSILSLIVAVQLIIPMVIEIL